MFIKVKDRGKLEFKDGSCAKEVADALNLTSPHEAVAVSINGVFRDFSTPLAEGDEVIFYNFENKEGKEVFWHSSAHVLAQAVLRLWPKATPTIGPPIENGFYYDFANLEISDSDFEKIEKEMKTIVDENYKSQREIFNSK